MGEGMGLCRVRGRKGRVTGEGMGLSRVRGREG